MSTPEDKLRGALHREAATVQPAEGWTNIESRLDQQPRRSKGGIVGLAAVAALILVMVAALVNQDGDGPDRVFTNDAGATSTSAANPGTTGPTFAWPAGTSTFATADALANAFAREFLLLANPTIDEYRAGDARSGEVSIHPLGPNTALTTLQVREYEGRWYLVSAESPVLEVATPTAEDVITSPLRLSGRSIAFEGVVRVAMLRRGTTLQCTLPTDSCGSDPGVFANTFFTGYGTELGPYNTEIEFTPPSDDYAVLVLWTESANDGSVNEATVRLVRLR